MRQSLVTVAIALAAWTQPIAQVGQPAPPSALRQNIGKAACNATNGVFRGRIVDVVLYTAAGQEPSWVYVVEREGRRTNAPPSNTTVLDRCPDGQPNPASISPAPQPAGDKPVVSQTLQGTAAEFGRRLVSSSGRLLRLVADAKAINVEWVSTKCDMIEGEIIDFLLSLNRGHIGPVKLDISARVQCGGKVRTFQASAAAFELYRAGKINDLGILKGLK